MTTPLSPLLCPTFREYYRIGQRRRAEGYSPSSGRAFRRPPSSSAIRTMRGLAATVRIVVGRVHVITPRAFASLRGRARHLLQPDSRAGQGSSLAPGAPHGSPSLPYPRPFSFPCLLSIRRRVAREKSEKLVGCQQITRTAPRTGDCISRPRMKHERSEQPEDP